MGALAYPLITCLINYPFSFLFLVGKLPYQLSFMKTCNNSESLSDKQKSLSLSLSLPSLSFIFLCHFSSTKLNLIWMRFLFNSSLANYYDFPSHCVRTKMCFICESTEKMQANSQLILGIAKWRNLIVQLEPSLLLKKTPPCLTSSQYKEQKPQHRL